MAGASHSGQARGSQSEAEFAVAARLAGRSYVELIRQIVELALARYAT